MTPSGNYLDQLQKGLGPNQRLSKIITDAMCIGCGLCESMIGADTLAMEIVSNGFERPIAKRELSEQQIKQIVATCPATKVEGLPKHLLKEAKGSTVIDPVWGAWRQAYYSFASNPETRHLASTGGVLTGLAVYLLESGSVDFILHAKASTQEPSFGEATISSNKEQVIQAAGSRYGPTATLKNIVATLDHAEAHSLRFAFIGTPCDISALRNFAKLDKRVDQLCTIMLTMVCGGFMSPMSMRASIEDKGIRYDDVAAIRYRGYGCPGPTTITMRNGDQHEFTYLEFWGEDESSWGLPPRCKVCADGIGESADIAAADCWVGGSPSAQDSASDPGRNAVIVRTERGEALMRDAIAANYLQREDTLTPADLNRFQPHQETKKRAVHARYRALHAAGKVYPQTSGLRLQQLWNMNSEQQNALEEAGTKLRIEQGKFSESEH